MSRATGASGLLLAPLTIYPVAVILFAGYAWYDGDIEAVFASPLTAFFFTLPSYPVAVLVLWFVFERAWETRSSSFKAAASIVLALIVGLPLFRVFQGSRWPPILVMGLTISVTALSWSCLYALRRRRHPPPRAATDPRRGARRG